MSRKYKNSKIVREKGGRKEERKEERKEGRKK